MKKRILSMILALVMLIGLLPIRANADEIYNNLRYRVYEDHVEIIGYIRGAAEVVIPAEIEGLPVTSIGDAAFSSSEFTSIEIPNSVTSIGNWAFSYSNFTSIDIPDSVISIGDSAFTFCNDMISIDLPNSMAYLGNSAFSQCYNLTSVNIPSGVTTIEAYTFEQCYSMTSVSIPNSVTSIEYDAFANCESLTNITIPASVTFIGDAALGYTLNRTITFEGDAPLFHYSAFDFGTITAYYPAGNTTWTEIIKYSLGGNITWIPYIPSHTHEFSAVSNTAPTCTALGFTTYACECGESYVSYVDALGHDYSHHICPRCGDFDTYLQYEVCEDHVKITGYAGHNTAVVIPAEIEGLPVTVIGDSAFEGCWTLTAIDIPDSVTFIGDSAFAGCKQLTAIDIPDGVTSIADRTFSRCEELHSVNIPDSVTSIGNSAFSECLKLDTIDIPDSVTSIGSGAFHYCSNLYSIDIPGSITSIESGVFAYCHRLRRVNIPDSVTSIGDRAFTGCDNLTPIDIPDSVTSIGEEAFSYCNFLTTIVIPDSVTSIGNQAFFYCPSLTTIVIPDSVASIGFNVFAYCRSLTEIHVDENNPNYSNDDRGVLFDKEKTLLIQAPGGISGSYTIPDSVTSIGRNAFHSCNGLTTIDIPDSVSSVEDKAFFSCDSLTRIHFAGNAPQFGDDIFKYTTANACYPPDDATWTEDIMQDYGGSITWIEHGPSHEYTVVVTAPTCTEQGFTTYTCVCGDSYIDAYVAALGHDYTAVITAPTCTSTGFTTYTCFCGHSYIDDRVAALGHDYTAIIKAPTCTERGFTTYTCVCGRSYTTDYTAALGHDFVDDVCTRCPASIGETPFYDVPAGVWYAKPVLWAIENNITSGTSATTFSPDDQCLRSHVMSFLWRAAGSPEPTSYNNSFSDVSSSDWFYTPVLWAVEQGITSGVSATEFGANDICSRYQVVFFLWKSAGSPEPTSTYNPFSDVKSTDFFYNAVLWAVENKITAGISPTEFGTYAPCTRAQVMTFLYNAYT